METVFGKMVELHDHTEPLIVAPKDGETHEYTVILLHGTSTSGPEFGTSLMEYKFPNPYFPSPPRDGRDDVSKTNLEETAPGSSSGQCLTSTSTMEEREIVTLQDVLPNMRWVFPTGMPRYTTVLGRVAHAWFDVHEFKDRTVGEEKQMEGLRDSTHYLKSLILEEVGLLESVWDNEPPTLSTSSLGKEAGRERGNNRKVDVQKRLVIGGFSQGAAMAGILALSGELSMSSSDSNIGIGGLVLMSGWLPFREQIQEAIEDGNMQVGAIHSGSSISKARSYILALLSLSNPQAPQTMQEFNLPIFMGHGGADEKVRVEWGEQMGDVLLDVGGEVNFNAYEGLRHWWCGEEMGDLVVWLSRLCEESG